MSSIRKLIIIIPIIFCIFFLFGCEKYTDDEWTVTFQNYDGSFITYVKVKDGEDATFSYYLKPTKPSDETHSYEFIGWDKPLTKIRKDCVLTAVFNETDRYYTVIFKNGWNNIDEQKCLYGGSVTFHGVEPTKADDAQGSYTFDGWDIDLNNITNDCVANAVFKLEKNVYDWVFYDEDGKTVLAKTTVKHGEKPEYPNETLPTKAKTDQYTYTFDRWDNLYSFFKATSSGSSKAVYTASVNYYTATFKNYDGTTLYTTRVKYGSTATYSGSTPTKPSTEMFTYQFSGWDKDITIYNDCTFTAQFKTNTREYKVEFIGDNDVVMYTQNVPYGGSATYTGNTPYKASTGQYNYAFSKWDKDFSKITSDTQIKAEFTATENIDYLKFTLSADEDYYIVSLGDTSVKYLEYYIPETYNDLPVKEIGLFKNTYVVNIHLPNSIEAIVNNAFYGNKNLKTINLEEGLKSIGTSAFYNCSALNSLSIPDTVETIGGEAFSNSGIIELIIPETVTSLGVAFKYMSSLQKITINANVTTIFENCFYNCKNLKSVTIGEHITTINSNAFYGCQSLQILEIPANVTTISYEAFSNSSITELTIPETVIGLGSAFKNMTSLQKVIINADITTITENMFYNCKSLSSVTLGEHITTISSNAFYGCQSLKALEIPSNVTTISYEAFSNSEITELTIPETVISLGAAFRNMSSLQKATINADIEALPENMFYNCTSLGVVSIGSYISTIKTNAFNGCKSLKTLEIPSNVTTISYEAFSNSGITELTIPETVTSMGAAFRNMSSLQKVTINANIETLADNMFYNCTSLSSVTLGDHITTFKSNTFNGCKLLTTLEIPSNVTTISYEAFSSSGITELIIPETVTSLGAAFRNMSSLQKVTIDANVESLPENAFYNCTSLSSVTLGEHITTLKPNTFNGCKLLKALEIPSNVTTIYYDAFSSSGIIELTIPETVTSMGKAFENMSSLKKVIIDANVEEIVAYSFKSCTSLSELVIGSNIKTIGSYAFSGCSSLKTLEIPSNVTAIVSNAFNGSGITSITIPETVTDLGTAFYSATSLHDVTINANVDSLLANTFYSCTALREVIIGHTITTINQNTFNGCTSIRDIYIENSQSDVTINDTSVNSNVYCYYSETASGENAWHYVDGVIVKWPK